MITGFRVARGGAQELYGVEPDLTVLGKVLGGGLPAAAFAGPRELMERIAPAGDVYQAGTLSGNPLATAAGLATLRQLDAAAYERLGRARPSGSPPASLSSPQGRPLQVAAVRRPGHPLLQRRAGHRLRRRRRLRPRGPRPLLPRDARRAAIYPPPSQFEAWFVSLAHDEAAIDRTLEAAAESLDGGAPMSEEAPATRIGALDRLAAALARGGDADLAPRGRPDRAAGLRPARRARAAPPSPPGEYALVVEAVREGYLLHYGEPRLLRGHDADLALLAGDYLYALGIERLAALGDAEAVAVLAELIGRCAQLHAEDREDEVPALWRAAALAVGGEDHGDRERRESIDSVLLRLSC